MSNLINFNFENQTVRVELKDGEPLFCLSDVATILGISRSSDLLQVAKDGFVKNETIKRGALDPDGVHKMSIIDNLNRIQEVNFISEPNLYRVIFRSNKKEAVKFQNWVFDEVLPSIRKTGSYEVAPIYPVVSVINPPIPKSPELYKTFIATVNTQGVMTMREMGDDEFVATYDNLPTFISHRSWGLPNETMAKIAKAALNKITGEWE